MAVPPIEPDKAAAEAMAQYDKNKDGGLDAKELDQCPALKQLSEKLNKKSLTAEDIAARVKVFQGTTISLMDVSCEVRQNDRPLTDATVTLVPESFLGTNIKPATGVTDKNGMARLKVEGLEAPGTYCGFFRVQVSKKDASGAETLPARFNAQTVLGQEVAPDMRGGLTIHLR